MQWGGVRATRRAFMGPDLPALPYRPPSPSSSMRSETSSVSRHLLVRSPTRALTAHLTFLSLPLPSSLSYFSRVQVFVSTRDRGMRTYRCQSAWKLVELDDQFRIFARSHCRTAIDLAAAPGGFAEVALERMARLNTHAKHSSTAAAHTNAHQPLVAAVDQRPIEPLHGMVTLQENILNHGRLLEQLDGVLQPPPAMMAAHADGLDAARTVEVVLHDGVSVVAGQRAFSVTYAQSQMTMSCLQLACRIFATYTARSGSSSAQVTPGSPSPSATSRRKPLPVFFVSKVMNCVHLSQVTAACRAFFSHVQVHKPAASKAESRERYLIAHGFKDGLWNAFENTQRTVACGGLPHTQSGRSSRGHSPNVFSLAPAIGDARAPGDIIWHCLGCGQTRMGTSACPVCTPHPRRHRK